MPAQVVAEISHAVVFPYVEAHLLGTNSFPTGCKQEQGNGHEVVQLRGVREYSRPLSVLQSPLRGNNIPKIEMGPPACAGGPVSDDCTRGETSSRALYCTKVIFFMEVKEPAFNS